MEGNRTALKIVTEPAIEPITLTEMKEYLRVTGTVDDAMITSFIISARTLVEQYTGRKLITQTWRYFQDDFPGSVKIDAILNDGVTDGKLSEFTSVAKYLKIPLYPLQSVTHLKTYDDANTAYTMPSTDYFVDTVSEPGRLSLKNDSSWPTTYLRPVNGIEIEFVCGYGAAAADVPGALKEAIKQLVAKYYMQRGCDAGSGGDGITSGISGIVLSLLNPYRIFKIW